RLPARQIQHLRPCSLIFLQNITFWPVVLGSRVPLDGFVTPLLRGTRTTSTWATAAKAQPPLSLPTTGPGHRSRPLSRAAGSSWAARPPPEWRSRGTQLGGIARAATAASATK